MYSEGRDTWAPPLGGLTCAEAGGPFLFHIGPQLPEDPFPLQQLLGPTDLRWRQPNVNLGIWGGRMCCQKPPFPT